MYMLQVIGQFLMFKILQSNNNTATVFGVETNDFILTGVKTNKVVLNAIPTALLIWLRSFLKFSWFLFYICCCCCFLSQSFSFLSVFNLLLCFNVTVHQMLFFFFLFWILALIISGHSRSSSKKPLIWSCVPWVVSVPGFKRQSSPCLSSQADGNSFPLLFARFVCLFSLMLNHLLFESFISHILHALYRVYQDRIAW